MASTTYSYLVVRIFVIIVIFAICGQALAGRDITKIAKNPDMKQPEFLHKSDPSFLIPGIGRVLAPPACGFPKSHLPFSGGTPRGGFGNPGGGAGSGSPGGVGSGSPGGGVGAGGQGYVPGGDDTFVPNPGVEVPNPGRGGGIPAPGAAHP